MHSKVSREWHCSAEPEKSQEQIKTKHEHWVELKAVIEGGGDEVEEGEHGDDGEEHGVVDNWRIASERIVNHVSDERHDEKCP